jgi:hypothetical protein
MCVCVCMFSSGIPLMFACCLNIQLSMWRTHVNQANAFHEVVAQYNKYLFKPRGIKVSNNDNNDVY